MRILHYSLGLPPARSGGMTRYAIDLMQEQSKTEEVALLYPGGYNCFFRARIIKQKRAFNAISVYRLQNPPIVPLLYGISNPNVVLMRTSVLSQKELEKFYNELQPDIFHIHTLMGLPIELLSFFKGKGVKLVYTSHDYFGLCPKVNFIAWNNSLCVFAEADKCAVCNMNSPSASFLRLRNSAFLLLLKNNRLLRKWLKI